MLRFVEPTSAVRILLCASMTVLAGAIVPIRAQESKEAVAWAFRHRPDPFTDKAAFDFRSLNERQAGQKGFLKRTADGNGFALGDGTPMRLWAVGSDVYHRGTREDMVRHARFLAKLGVNMVRVHAQIPLGAKGSKLTDVNQPEIDRIWQFVAALKSEGIYVTISPYWASRRHVTGWDIDGYTGESELWGLLFFDEKLQAGYKAWVRALYEPKNPYTGISLAKEPAVGLIQVQNEDSLLFWTMQGIKPVQRDRLGAKFAAWAIAKYGTLEKTQRTWGGAKHDQDDFANGKAGIHDVWHMTQEQKGGMSARLADQTQFLAETQRRFYADMADFYRKELGCKQLLNASNWVTADPVKLNDIERWTYTAMDVLAVNRYTGGVHAGEHNGWRIDPGHHFTNQSCLLDPRGLPVNLKQVVGHPTLVTESTWVHPESYQAEAPFLVAAYQSLTGVDGFYWFSATTAEYDLDPRLKFLNLNGQNPLFKWSCSTPCLMGQFPAAALMYRKGYLRQGDVVVHEERPLADMWERKVPLIAEDRGFDPNRYTGLTGVKADIKGGADPLAFLVGPVEVKYGGDPAKNTTIDLSKYIDRENKRVRSITGEIDLDYGIGLCTINAPKAQGVCGFLNKAGDVTLGDVTIRSGNEYAAVLVVSLDEKTLRESGKMLVQVGTAARLTGWKTKPATFKDQKKEFQGFEILRTGEPPWQIVETSVTLTIANVGVKSATVLDTGGYPVRKVAGEVADGKLILKLPPDAMYVVVE